MGYEYRPLLTPDTSELLAKTGEEVVKIHKQQLDSSREVLEISAVLGSLNVSFQDWVETHSRQLEDIRESMQSNEDPLYRTSNSLLVLTRRIHVSPRTTDFAKLAKQRRSLHEPQSCHQEEGAGNRRMVPLIRQIHQLDRVRRIYLAIRPW